MVDMNTAEAFRQGEQSAQMRSMNTTLERLQDMIHELESAFHKYENRSVSERHLDVQEIWAKIEALKREVVAVRSEVLERVNTLVSDQDLLEFQRAHFTPLKEKVDRMEEFRLKALGVVLAVATILGAMSSYIMDELFKRGGA